MNYKLLLIFDFVKFSGQCPLCPKQLLLGPRWVQCQPDPGISRILNFWRYWSRWSYQSTKFSPYDFDDSSTHCDSICFHSIGLFSMAPLRVRIIGILFQKLFLFIVRFFFVYWPRKMQVWRPRICKKKTRPLEPPVYSNGEMSEQFKKRI